VPPTKQISFRARSALWSAAAQGRFHRITGGQDRKKFSHYDKPERKNDLPISSKRKLVGLALRCEPRRAEDCPPYLDVQLFTSP
jgi:hypothetical protein